MNIDKKANLFYNKLDINLTFYFRSKNLEDWIESLP